MALNDSGNGKGKPYKVVGYALCAQREVAQGKNISGFMGRVSGLDDYLGALKCKDCKIGDMKVWGSMVGLGGGFWKDRYMRVKILVSYVNTHQKSSTLAEALNNQVGVEKIAWPVDLGNFVVGHLRSGMISTR